MEKAPRIPNPRCFFNAMVMKIALLEKNYLYSRYSRSFIDFRHYFHEKHTIYTIPKLFPRK